MGNSFNTLDIKDYKELPLEDTLSTKAWAKYIEEINLGKPVIEVLRSHLINLNFPIKEGMSEDEEYLKAVRRGIEPDIQKPFKFTADNNIKVYLYHSIAGNVPIIEFKEEEDFNNMVRSLVYKNEKKEIPKSMGACLVKGYNNWSRIKELKKECIKDGKQWSFEFQKIKNNKEMYQDSILLLSNKFYSNVDSSLMNLDEKKWREYSLIIRREHEVLHYCTLRLFKSAQNNIHHELIADYMGIVKAFNEYKAECFLKFMGIENYPSYRMGGRLQNYTDDYMSYCDVTKKAAENIERLCNEYGKEVYSEEKTYKMLCTLVKLDLEDIAYRYNLLWEEFISGE